MSALDPRIDGWIDALIERIQVQLRAELANLAASLGEAVERQQAEAAREARSAAESAANALLTEAIAAERSLAAQQSEAIAADARQAATAAQATIDQLTAELAALQERSADAAADAAQQRAALVANAYAEERETDLDVAAALAEACRALDAAPNLSTALTTLLDHAARRVNRCALLVVKGTALRVWEWRGFGDKGPAAEIEVAASDRTPVARAWASRSIETSAPDEAGAHVLGPCRAGRVGIALPVLVDGRVVAVLYADDDGDARQVPSAWPEQLELLVRYAGRCLGWLTMRRMPELMRASAAERSRTQAPPHDDESAQRYARLLVSEIKLYHEAALDEARRDGNILRRLRPQIERAQALYNERVPAAARANTTYFEDELVRTLAGGDQTLMGQST